MGNSSITVAALDQLTLLTRLGAVAPLEEQGPGLGLTSFPRAHPTLAPPQLVSERKPVAPAPPTTPRTVLLLPWASADGPHCHLLGLVPRSPDPSQAVHVLWSGKEGGANYLLSVPG